MRRAARALTGASGRAPAGRGLDSGYAQDFCQSLEEAGPEIRACVDACNHIANATREQNDFSSVSRGWGGTAGAGGSKDKPSAPPRCAPTGERGVDPGGAGDRPRLLLHHGLPLRLRHRRHLPHGSLQPGTRPALPRRPQAVPAAVTPASRCQGLDVPKISVPGCGRSSSWDRGGRAVSPPCCGGDGEHGAAVVVPNVEVNLVAVLWAPVASLSNAQQLRRASLGCSQPGRGQEPSVRLCQPAPCPLQGGFPCPVPRGA